MDVVRFTRGDWGTYVPIGLPGGGPTVANPNGCQCLALGPKDQSGGCTVIPSSGPYQGANLRVGVGAPLLVPLAGPFIVVPDFAINSSNYAHTIDLLQYRCAPPFVPVRPPVYLTGTMSTNATVYIPAAGRTHMSVVALVTGANNNNFSISAYMLDSSNGVNPVVLFSTQPAVNTTTYSYAISPDNAPSNAGGTASRTDGTHTPDRFDFLVLTTTGGSSSGISYSVRLSDY